MRRKTFNSQPDIRIPQYAALEVSRYKKEFLAKNSQSAGGLTYRFFYNEKGDACLEYTVIPKGKYTWPAPTWIGMTWGNRTGSIGNGSITYAQTKKACDEACFRMEERRKDPVFRKIEKIIFQIAKDYDYDFEKAYGRRVKYRNSKTVKAVCDGYADAVVRAFENHQLVSKTEKWSSLTGNHAWNVIVLKDKRKLYCDAAWYDGNNIDKHGFAADIPVQSPVNLTFDKNEFNSLGGSVNKATGKLLAVHFGWKDARLID